VTETTEWQIDRIRHVEYMMGATFEQLMETLYAGTASLIRPPFIEEIMQELLEGSVVLQEENREFFIQGASEDDLLLMFANMDVDQVMRIERDVYQYIHEKRLFVLYNKGLGSKTLYEPVVSTW